MNILHTRGHDAAGFEAMHCLRGFKAICASCKVSHHIPPSEAIGAQPWLDWLAKHPAPYHLTALVEDNGDLLNEVANGMLCNADVKAAYVASADYTCTLTGLATDANLLTGRESNGISNGTNKYLDEMVSGKITAGTSPTAAKVIEVHAIGALDDTPNYPDVFDGTDSAETITSADIKAAIVAPIAIMGTSNTSDRTYPFKMTGLRQLFGDVLPVAHDLFVTHSTAVNLNATAANQKLTHTPAYATVI